MASIRRLETTIPSVNGGAEYAILAEKAAIYPYENGKKVSDTPIGTKLTVALPGYRLTPLAVNWSFAGILCFL